MISRKAVLAAAVLVVMMFALVVPAMAAPKVPPSLADITGLYSVKFKWIEFDFDTPVADKGSYNAFFDIYPSGTPGQVILDWYNDDGFLFDSFEGFYSNGVLVVGQGDIVEEPADNAEVMIFQFTGNPGKIKLTGTDTYYFMSAEYISVDTGKGKMIDQI